MLLTWFVLQRAERSEAVKRCVRSRTTEQRHQKNQREQEVRANPSDEPALQSLTTANAPDVVHQHNRHAGGEYDWMQSWLMLQYIITEIEMTSGNIVTCKWKDL